MPFAVLLALPLATPAAQSQVPGLPRDGHEGLDCMESKEIPSPLCPEPTPEGSSCVAHGIVVTEQDLTGPGGTISTSESRALADPAFGSIREPFFPGDDVQTPPRPADPQAEADARQANFSYSTMFGPVNASAVFSECEVQSLWDERWGLQNVAYGRAGVAELDLPVPLEAEVLDYELGAVGTFEGTAAYAACDTLLVPQMGLGFCPSPFTGFDGAVVSVTLNELSGPVMNQAGQWVYSGSAAHIRILAPSVVQLDIRIGYVAVAVSGFGEHPPEWIPGDREGPIGLNGPLS